MLSRIQSFLLTGIDAHRCEVELDLDETNLSKSIVVGLPDAAVKESLERVQAAVANVGYAWPMGRIVVNLAPADVRKEGPMYDLPIALAVLGASNVLRQIRQSATTNKKTSGRSMSGVISALTDGQITEHDVSLDRLLIAGELALDGRLRPIKGVIGMAALAQSLGLAGVMVPRENAAEAAVVHGIAAIGVSTLSEAVGVLSGELEPWVHPPVDVASILRAATATLDFADIKGQEGVKRAALIAASGNHNLLLIGPAGTGKSMIAKALPGILPPLEPAEAIEVTRIYSAAGLLPPGTGLITSPPVRTPHHTASGAAIIGGGNIPRPGEVSLAHRGVLFLDEMAEFPRVVLETLRQPLEDHQVTIARSHSATKFPANFMLVAAMNPTPRGDMPRNDVGRREMDRYLAKLSGPLIDRIDIHVEAPAVPIDRLTNTKAPPGTDTKTMRQQAMAARERQKNRQGAGTPNARLSGRQLDQLAPVTSAARVLLSQAMTELGLSARAYDKIRRVARTIADLDGKNELDVPQVAEAIQYRLLDRQI